MIRNRKELREYLRADRCRTELVHPARYLRGMVCHEPYFKIWQYIRALRTEEYHTNRTGIRHRLLHYYWRRKRNRLGEQTELFIEPGVFGAGLKIWHPGIVVNSCARVGKNCTLHGQNCIGNDGYSDDAPVMGDNVTLGAGASVIGAVRLADGITVGAGAVVVDSFLEPGITLGGVPARRLKR